MAADSLLGLSYVFVLGATLLTQAGVAYWVYRYQRDQSGSTWFLVMVGAGVVWVLPMLLALVLQGREAQIVAYAVGHLGIILTVGAFIVFASKYTGTGFHRNRVLQASLVGVLLAYLVLAPTSVDRLTDIGVLSNFEHDLIFVEFQQEDEPFSYLAITRGPVYQAMALLIQLPVFYASYRLAGHLLTTQRRGGVQLALFVVGALSIIAVEYVDQLTNVLPAAGFPNATLGMFAFYLCTGLALFRFRLLDAKPVARNTVIEDLQSPVVVVDGRNRVVDYNEAATTVWPDLPGQTPESFAVTCPELADDIDIESLGSESTTKTTISHGGERRHYSVTVSPVTIGNETTGWRSVLLRDITELQRSRTQLEAQNERLNKVASTISHDLRNPINVAAGHVQLLESELDDEELRTHAGKARDAHDRMLDIIDDILTIAREGETVEQTERVELAAIAEEAWGHATTRSGTLTVESDRAFQADRSKVLTVFENLFRNAFDHGPDDTEVTVGATETGFYIADDGPGIPEEIHDSIFQFGYTTGDEGTGLGLAIVQTMARSHGWTVELDDDYDDGARFVFSGVEETKTRRESTGAPA
jgi:nitrogen-specific signal transduction histidine kinase